MQSQIRDIGKQETLDWASSGEMAIDNLKIIYENDEVGVIHHSATRNHNEDGVAIAVFTKKDGKISGCRIVRTAT